MTALPTSPTTCEAIASGGRHRPVAGRSAELRCAVCWRKGLHRGGRHGEVCVAVAHVRTSHDGTYSGLCVHDRTKSGHRKAYRDADGEHGHEDYFGLTADRDQDAAFVCTWKCRRGGHRVRETTDAILDDIERGRTVVYIDAA